MLETPPEVLDHMTKSGGNIDVDAAIIASASLDVSLNKVNCFRSENGSDVIDVMSGAASESEVGCRRLRRFSISDDDRVNFYDTLSIQVQT